jgi:cytochrome c-type biogenesis protein CcmH
MNSLRRRLAAVALTALAITLLLAAPAGAVRARASLMDIENEVMCVVCNESLAVAQSPQAYQERNLIRSLIAKGDTKAQIERVLVANYGVAVLGKPPAHGFNLAVYVLPPAAVLAGIALLAFTLPRWRRRVSARAELATPTGPSLSVTDQQRLDDELSRFGG